MKDPNIPKAGLVAGYVGQTAKKTEGVFKSALGGVLFIDEAYSIINDGTQDLNHDFLLELIFQIIQQENCLKSLICMVCFILLAIIFVITLAVSLKSNKEPEKNYFELGEYTEQNYEFVLGDYKQRNKSVIFHLHISEIG